jgi:hypothetical protein
VGNLQVDANWNRFSALGRWPEPLRTHMWPEDSTYEQCGIPEVVGLDLMRQQQLTKKPLMKKVAADRCSFDVTRSQNEGHAGRPSQLKMNPAWAW